MRALLGPFCLLVRACVLACVLASSYTCVCVCTFTPYTSTYVARSYTHGACTRTFIHSIIYSEYRILLLLCAPGLLSATVQLGLFAKYGVYRKPVEDNNNNNKDAKKKKE